MVWTYGRMGKEQRVVGMREREVKSRTPRRSRPEGDS